MQTTTALAHYIRVATRRVDDTLFMQLRMWMGIFRPRPLQLRTQPRRATPIVLDQSLVQSTTTNIQDEKSAEDDDEDELITVPSPQKPSPRYRAERQSRTDWEALIRDKLAQKAWTTRRLAIRRWQMQQNNSSVRCITWTHANWAKPRRSASPLGSNIRRAYLHHIRSTEVRSIGGHVANQRQHDNLHHSLARAVDRLAAHAARHGTDAITRETNNGVLCTQ